MASYGPPRLGDSEADYRGYALTAAVRGPENSFARPANG
jgi:hypothetical protein